MSALLRSSPKAEPTQKIQSIPPREIRIFFISKSQIKYKRKRITTIEFCLREEKLFKPDRIILFVWEDEICEKIAK